MDWNARVLQDLVYERVRHHVDVVSLIELEHEIADYVERALEREGEVGSEANTTSRRLLDEAWERLESEWRRLRDADCPLCSELYGCSSSIT